MFKDWTLFLLYPLNCLQSVCDLLITSIRIKLHENNITLGKKFTAREVGVVWGWHPPLLQTQLSGIRTMNTGSGEAVRPVLHVNDCWKKHRSERFNPLNTKLNPICHLPVLLGAHPILHVSRVRVNDIRGFKVNKCPTRCHYVQFIIFL